MKFIGIDPGAKGAMAIISEEISIVPFDCQDYIVALSMLDKNDCVCCIENVHSMPGQGVASSFKFGQNFGWIMGVLSALHIPYQLVSPQKWKRDFSVTSDKQTSIDCCKRLFPDICLRKNSRCRTDDDGIAEAVLMAEYARRHFGYSENKKLPF